MAPEITFASPWALLLAAAPVAILLARHYLRRRYWGFTGEVAWSDRIAEPRPWRLLPDVLAVLAMAALAVALADPRLTRSVVDTSTEGTPIVLVLDLSASMQERVGPVVVPDRPPATLVPQADPRPTRLDVLKVALKDFVSLRKEDRIGLVVFAESAYVISPMTTDYEYLGHYIDMIDDQTMGGEALTGIGEGIAVATSLLDFQGVKDGKRGFLLVFTDGNNNTGRDPVEEVFRMAGAGHRGYIIGVDLPAYVSSKETVIELFQAFIATGGQYFNARSGPELERAYRAVSALERESLKVESRIEAERVFPVAVRVCIVLLVASLLLRAVPPFVELS